MPCHRLLVGFRARWPLAGFSPRRGSKQARAIDSHQECPPWHHHWLSHEEGFVFIIGIDPHKGSHTAAVLDCSETVIDEVRVVADRRQRDRLLHFAAGFTPRAWAIVSASGLGACRPRSLSPPARRCWMCRRRCRRGCGCSTPAVPTRPTRTTPGRRRSSRYVTAGCGRSARWITPRCCGCWPTGTTTSPGCGPRRSAGSTPCCVA
jgi:hypothetical protein